MGELVTDQRALARVRVAKTTNASPAVHRRFNTRFQHIGWNLETSVRLDPVLRYGPYPVSMEVLTIGQLAREAGVNIQTVRYYERRRLLREPPRTGSGYRQYSVSDLWRLQFIGRAKQLGFTLAEIATLVGPDSGSSAESVVAMARTKMEALDENMKALSDTRWRLERLIDICADPDSEDCTALKVTG
jgi:MerR family copper efflux transcriptional regulator